MLGTLIDFMVGLAFMFAGIGAAINDASPAVFGSVFGSVLELACGFAQWLILRKQLENVVVWIVSTCSPYWKQLMQRIAGRMKSALESISNEQLERN